MNGHPEAARIVAAARGWIGTPYLHQASLRGVGCDCLGLLRGVWREVIGGEPEPLPAYAPDWAEATGIDSLAAAAGRHLAPLRLEDALAGDVLLFRWREGLPAGHVGLLVARERMIHAHDGLAVTEVAIGPWWLRHRAGAWRFPLGNRKLLPARGEKSPEPAKGG
jgi:NlpC/P60 family putative phage cell wall peptidase